MINIYKTILFGFFIGNISFGLTDIDNSVIESYLNDDKIKNLLKLSTDTELYCFKKNRNKWKLKDKRQIIRECKKMKKTIITKKKVGGNISDINSASEQKELGVIDSILRELDIDLSDSEEHNFIEVYSN